MCVCVVRERSLWASSWGREQAVVTIFALITFMGLFRLLSLAFAPLNAKRRHKAARQRRLALPCPNRACCTHTGSVHTRTRACAYVSQGHLKACSMSFWEHLTGVWLRKPRPGPSSPTRGRIPRLQASLVCSLTRHRPQHSKAAAPLATQQPRRKQVRRTRPLHDRAAARSPSLTLSGVARRRRRQLRLLGGRQAVRRRHTTCRAPPGMWGAATDLMGTRHQLGLPLAARGRLQRG